MFPGGSAEFYRAWPDVTSVTYRWRPLLEPLYQTLSIMPLFFSKPGGGRWVSLQQAVLQRFPSTVCIRISCGRRNTDEMSYDSRYPQAYSVQFNIIIQKEIMFTNLCIKKKNKNVRNNKKKTYYVRMRIKTNSEWTVMDLVGFLSLCLSEVCVYLIIISLFTLNARVCAKWWRTKVKQKMFRIPENCIHALENNIYTDS
jgi:hypothetical protein